MKKDKYTNNVKGGIMPQEQTTVPKECGDNRLEVIDAINPLHYKQVKDIECIEVTCNFNFCLGNAIKYIWRCNSKGRKVEDLKKAIWYLEKEIDNTLKHI